MNLRQAAQQALEALEASIDVPCYGGHPKQEAAAAALRAQLEQQAEPVAWECKAGGLKPLSQRQYAAQPKNIQRHYTRIPPQQQAEPVAWVVYSSAENDIVWADKGKRLKQNTPLYTAPPKRKPLTDEDIEQAQRTVWRSLPSDFDYTTSSWIELGIRYAEAAHGIGEKP